MNTLKITLERATQLKIDYAYLESQNPVILNGISYPWIRLFAVPSDYKSTPTFISNLLQLYFSSELSLNPAWVYSNDQDEYTILVVIRHVPIVPSKPEFEWFDFKDFVKANSIAFNELKYF